METLEKLEAKLASDPSQENYNLLLSTYPLLFGYWIKYATEHANTDPSIWDRALAACPSVELWTAYLDRQGPATKQDYEKATVAVGRFFLSGPIWDRYLTFLGDTDEQAKVLAGLIRLPLYEYAKYYELATQAQKKYPQAFDFDLPAIAQVTAHNVTERWPLESKISRFYYHVVPLERPDQEALDAYLDYEEAQGDIDQTKALYERTLVAAADLKGFWLRYVRWLSLVDPNQVDSVFERASKFLKNDASWTVERARYRAGLGLLNALDLVKDLKDEQAVALTRVLAGQATQAAKKNKSHVLEQLKDQDLTAFFNKDILSHGDHLSHQEIKTHPL